jgi:uncharacterized RDD family membrane protein YckC
MDEVTAVTPGLAPIAGFWRRLFAFCLDSLVLGAIGACIGLFAFDGLAALGNWGRAVGFAIALAYFGAMDSKPLGGQTLGQRILGVKVVDVTGSPLGVGASVLRAAIFCVPYFLNGAFVNAGAMTSWLSILLAFLVFGVGFSIAYLLIFNRRTRQSLHDLAVGAYVVSGKDGPIGGRGAIWPVHFGVVALILLVAIVLPFFAQRLASTDTFVRLLAVQQGLEQEPEVRHATASIRVNKFTGNNHGTTTTHVFESRLFVARRVTDLNSLADRAARIILDRDPSAGNQDIIAVSITYGYDIGIASAWRTQNFSFSPTQWRTRFLGSTPLPN